jgi:hypothetical protein
VGSHPRTKVDDREQAILREVRKFL